MTQLILSYGADISVLKPEALKESIVKIWQRAVKDSVEKYASAPFLLVKQLTCSRHHQDKIFHN
jgi:hypothetical protein